MINPFRHMSSLMTYDRNIVDRRNKNLTRYPRIQRYTVGRHIIPRQAPASVDSLVFWSLINSSYLIDPDGAEPETGSPVGGAGDPGFGLADRTVRAAGRDCRGRGTGGSAV